MNINHDRRKKMDRQGGYLLPMALIYIVISLLLGMGILAIGEVESIASAKRTAREQAFYLAEAGAYRAYAHLQGNINWEPEPEPLSMGDGEFSVEIDADGNVVSTGSVRGISETVKLFLAPGGIGNIWDQGLFGAESFETGEAMNTIIAGYDSSVGTDPGSRLSTQVGSHEHIYIGNNAVIYGVAAVSSSDEETSITGGGSTEPPENHTYNTEFDEPLKDLWNNPVIIPDSLKSANPPAGADISGNYSLEDDILIVNGEVTINSGSYRFKEIILTNNSTLTFGAGELNLYVEDKIEIRNGAVWNMGGPTVLYLGEDSTMETKPNQHIQVNTYQDDLLNFRIYSASERDDAININNNRDLTALLYVPRGGVQIKNKAVFFGGIVANTIDIGNRVQIFYDINLKNRDYVDDDLNLNLIRPARITRWTKPGWAGRLQ